MPDWDNQKALTIFEQMLQKTSNKIDGVLAANDGLGNAAISALKQRKLPQIPVTGQDATLEGIQNIVTGDQCMTVYKAIQKEADAAGGAGHLAGEGRDARRRHGADRQRHAQGAERARDAGRGDEGQHRAVLRNAGYPKKEDICAGKVAADCKKLGL